MSLELWIKLLPAFLIFMWSIACQFSYVVRANSMPGSDLDLVLNKFVELEILFNVLSILVSTVVSQIINTEQLKQTTVPWIRSLNTVQLGSLLGVLPGCNQVVTGLFSSGGLTGAESTSKLTRPVGTIHFLGLDDGGPLFLLAVDWRLLSECFLSVAAHFLNPGRRSSWSSLLRLDIMWHNHRWTPHPLYHIPLASGHSSHSHPRVGMTQRHRHQEVRNPCGSALHTFFFSF